MREQKQIIQCVTNFDSTSLVLHDLSVLTMLTADLLEDTCTLIAFTGSACDIITSEEHAQQPSWVLRLLLLYFSGSCCTNIHL